MGKIPRKPWTRDDQMITLYVYHKLNAESFSVNTLMGQLAKIIEHSADSIVMKLNNFRELDKPGKGLNHTTISDRDTWKEYKSNPDKFIAESERLLRSRVNIDDENKRIALSPSGIKFIKMENCQQSQVVKPMCAIEFEASIRDGVITIPPKFFKAGISTFARVIVLFETRDQVSHSQV